MLRWLTKPAYLQGCAHINSNMKTWSKDMLSACVGGCLRVPTTH